MFSIPSGNTEKNTILNFELTFLSESKWWGKHVFLVVVYHTLLSFSLHFTLSIHNNLSIFPAWINKSFPSLLLNSKEKQKKGGIVKGHVDEVKRRHTWAYSDHTLQYLGARQFKSGNCRGTPTRVQSRARMCCLSTHSHFSCTAYSCSNPLERDYPR